MADIVESLLRESQCRISPSWCPAQHIETFTFAIALAENVIDRRCIIEPIDPEEEALDSRDSGIILVSRHASLLSSPGVGMVITDS